MRILTNKNFARQTSGALLLGLLLLGGSASAATIDPSVKLPGIAPIGNPSFQFDAKTNDYSNTIQSWFNNLVYVKRQHNKKTYKLASFNRGDFTYAASADELYNGTNGNFQLRARFGKKGGLIGGRVVMTGMIEELGILKEKVLFRASLKRYKIRNHMLGFSIDNIRCAAEIENCQDDPAVAESVYLKLKRKLPNIRSIKDQKFATTVIANTTTVPLPAGIWLMLSGLGALVARARLKAKA